MGRRSDGADAERRNVCVCVSMCVSLLKHPDTSNSRARRSEGADAERWNRKLSEKSGCRVLLCIRLFRHPLLAAAAMALPYVCVRERAHPRVTAHTRACIF